MQSNTFLLTLGREPTMICGNPLLCSFHIPYSLRIAYSSYLNSLMLDFTPTKTKTKMSNGRKKYIFSHLSSAQYYWIVAFYGEIHDKSIILRYENFVTKVNKISFLRQSVPKWMLQAGPIADQILFRIIYLQMIFFTHKQTSARE